MENQIEVMEKLQENIVKQLQVHTTNAASLEHEINTIASEIQK